MTGWRGNCAALLAAAILMGAPTHCWASGCMASATPIAFGAYQPLHPADAVSVSTITYSCTGVKGRVRISLSRGESGTFARRVMHLGNKRLEYNLYLDPTGVSIWGDGSGGSQVYITSDPTNGAPVNLTVYGRIEARQGAPAGMYRDNVFVVIDP
jgi:spore coat protein U-like protein